MHWQIQTRHSPCVVKRATVVAASEDEALKEFVRLNIETAQRKHTKNWKFVVQSIEEWMRRGGLDEAEVVEVAAPALPDVEVPAEATTGDARTDLPVATDTLATEPPSRRVRKRKRKVPAITTAEPVTVSGGGGDGEVDMKFVV